MTKNTSVLAYLGDAVYELHVRKYMVDTGQIHADRLHTGAVRFVRAGAQATVIKALFPGLPEQEQALVRRARNRKTNTKPRNADPVEYKWATAFEALLGYYYLSEQDQKLEDAILRALSMIEEEEKK